MNTPNPAEEKVGADHADQVDDGVSEKNVAPHDDPIFSDPDYRSKEKKMVRTLDFTMLPMLWILYLFNYLDRTNVACVCPRLVPLS